MAKIVASLLITWNEWYFGGASNWGDVGLFTPTLGSYINSDPAVIAQQIKWMDEAGIDLCFVALDYDNCLKWMNLFLAEAEKQNSKVKIAPYLNGSKNFGADVNRVLEAIETMMNAGIFDHPKCFKWNGRPVVSGYLFKPIEFGGKCHIEYWIEVHQKYPQLFKIANGWHPNYWEKLSDVVDCMSPWAVQYYPDDPVNGNKALYENCVSQWNYPVKAYAAIPGCDDTGIPKGSSKVNRENGETYRKAWSLIKTLSVQPKIVFTIYNEYGECSGVESISASRSSTTGAFGDFYIKLTRQLGDAWKGVTPKLPLAISGVGVGGLIGYGLSPETPLVSVFVGAFIGGAIGYIIGSKL
ncbi:hypothetical protein ES702_02195 [subsurface metagenome]